MPECRLRFSYIILQSAEFVSPTPNISYTIAFILSPLYCFFTYLVLDCLESKPYLKSLISLTLEADHYIFGKILVKLAMWKLYILYI